MSACPVFCNQLPDIWCDSTQGKINLAALHHHLTILYFYPRDLTAGCSLQAQEFRDLQPAFAALNACIYGVSRDSLSTHHTFSLKEHLPFALISDPDQLLCRCFDVIKTKNMYGKQVQGIERSTFIFNANGQLVQQWRKVKAAGHARVVLDFSRNYLLANESVKPSV